MDLFEALQELHKESTAITTRKRTEKNNGTCTTHGSRTREVSSRYKSPIPTNSKRYPSPNLTRNINPTLPSAPSKRAVSTERKRPSTPPSPCPSTPVSDASAESQLSAKKTTGSRLPEVLWPSTMRSLSVSFQSDSISIPVVKKNKEKLANSDRTLKPTSNVTHKQGEFGGSARKPTPERKRSPLKGKNSNHQSENSRPVDSSQSKLIDQHRWPSRTGGGRLSSNIMTKSVDFTNRSGNFPRRLSAEGIPRRLNKASSDSSEQSEFEDHIGMLGLRMNSLDDNLLQMSAKHKNPSAVPDSSVRSGIVHGSRLPSPSMVSISSAPPSPLKTRPSTPTQSRGASPSRMRHSGPARQSSSTTSVLSFIADIKKGKKNNQLEEVHQLRLLYNRHLQWRFANARAEAALYSQEITAEETLYNVWQTNLELWACVIRKCIDLQQLNLELKLNSVLSEQMAYLEGWALLERDHSTSLSGVIKGLEACTLRLPVTGGAKVDTDSLKAAIGSAVDVMQAMGSSICHVVLKVEEMNGLVSDLSELAGYQRAMLNECEALLGSTSVMQVKEYSLRTQFIQTQQDLNKTRHPLLLWAS